MTNPKQLFIIIILIGILFGAGYFYNKKNQTVQTVCTLEAKLCPDGSYVGRSGPKCEFTPCPEVPTHADWKTYNLDGITFQYPEKLPTIYMDLQDWPPQVQIINEPFGCLEAGSTIERAGRTEIRVINGHTYCVTQLTQGAAGSTYNQYAYAKAFNDQTVIFTFTTREPQCMNYEDPKQTECLNERNSFSIDNFIDEIISTLKINR
jgi:hypothetical protein